MKSRVFICVLLPAFCIQFKVVDPLSFSAGPKTSSFTISILRIFFPSYILKYFSFLIFSSPIQIPLSGSSFRINSKAVLVILFFDAFNFSVSQNWSDRFLFSVEIESFGITLRTDRVESIKVLLLYPADISGKYEIIIIIYVRISFNSANDVFLQQ